jgi:hypothetical protein
MMASTRRPARTMPPAAPEQAALNRLQQQPQAPQPAPQQQPPPMPQTPTGGPGYNRQFSGAESFLRPAGRIAVGVPKGSTGANLPQASATTAPTAPQPPAPVAPQHQRLPATTQAAQPQNRNYDMLRSAEEANLKGRQQAQFQSGLQMFGGDRTKALHHALKYGA